MRAADLNLIEPALSAAMALERRFPSLVFTSGRRDIEAQARAMAQNVAEAGNGWISRTYRPSSAITALEDAVDTLPQGSPETDYYGALYEALEAMTPEELTHVSAHLGGLAFDIKPQGTQGVGKGTIYDSRVLVDFLGTFQGFDKFLTSEGGLCRWHVQFKPLPEPPAQVTA